MGRYLLAQICLNGHTITDRADQYPEHRQDYCSKCGAPTIMACPQCNAPIRGYHYVEGAVYVAQYSPPQFCYKCGSAYPWVEARLSAARELADELDDLSAEERDRLKANLEQLTRDVPATEAAAIRVKKLFLKLKSGSAETLRQMLVDIASETAKKVLGL